MLNSESVPDVTADETMCRFLVSKSHINRQSWMVKADAFLPPASRELSVTRMTQATDNELWTVGRNVAAVREPPRTLRGRAEVLAATFLDQSLQIIADPVDDNPNHANVTGWPMEKESQLMKAKEIAAVAKFVPPPK